MWGNLYKILLKEKCIAYILCIVIGMAPLFACKGQQKDSDPKASLAGLAEKYWEKRLIDLDYKFTYNMEAQKDSVPFSEYLQRVKNAGQIKVLSIKTTGVEVEGDKGHVYMRAKCKIAPVPKEVELPLEDRWIYQSNQWKHDMSFRNKK